MAWESKFIFFGLYKAVEMFKRVLGISGIAILTLAIAVGVNMWRASGDVIGGADNSTSTVKVVEVSTYPTQLGECYSKLPSIQGLSTVIATSCTDVHHWQIVSIGTLALDTFDAAKTQEGANQICTKQWMRLLKPSRKSKSPNIRMPVTQVWRLRQLLGIVAGALWTVYWAAPLRLTQTRC